ncbi:hypothetical protein Tcan_07450 [Toxocara canis]|uniref:Uncharacterized protein n=1 Tax=Toxocara canis TaxID=6265 RepID=A0A0B2W2R8_TOXCA|nr:hypothetical protein Tcan_07450 [Toxocara canis]
MKQVQSNGISTRASEFLGKNGIGEDRSEGKLDESQKKTVEVPGADVSTSSSIHNGALLTHSEVMCTEECSVDAVAEGKLGLDSGSSGDTMRAMEDSVDYTLTGEGFTCERVTRDSLPLNERTMSAQASEDSSVAMMAASRMVGVKNAPFDGQINVEHTKRIISSLRAAYAANLDLANSVGDFATREACSKVVKELDDLFTDVHLGVANGVNLPLPPAPYKLPVDVPVPHPFPPRVFAPSAWGHYFPYPPQMRAGIPATYIPQFGMPTPYAPSPVYISYMPPFRQPTPLYREDEKSTSTAIVSDAKYIKAAERVSKNNGARPKSELAKDESRPVKHEPETVEDEHSEMKLVSKIGNDESKQMKLGPQIDEGGSVSVEPEVKIVGNESESVKAKMEVIKDGAQEGTSFAAASIRDQQQDEEEICVAADEMLCFTSVDRKPPEYPPANYSDIAKKWAAHICNVQRLLQLLIDVDGYFSAQQIELNGENLEEKCPKVLLRLDCNHFSELILWEIVLIQEEDFSFYLNPIIREMRFLVLEDSEWFVFLNVLRAKQIRMEYLVELMNSGSGNTLPLRQRQTALWEILLSEKLRDVFVIETMLGPGRKTELWVRINRCLDVSNVVPRLMVFQ